jgi:hypothetical protein
MTLDTPCCSQPDCESLSLEKDSGLYFQARLTADKGGCTFSVCVAAGVRPACVCHSGGSAAAGGAQGR